MCGIQVSFLLGEYSRPVLDRSGGFPSSRFGRRTHPTCLSSTSVSKMKCSLGFGRESTYGNTSFSIRISNARRSCSCGCPRSSACDLLRRLEEDDRLLAKFGKNSLNILHIREKDRSLVIVIGVLSSQIAFAVRLVTSTGPRRMMWPK